MIPEFARVTTASAHVGTLLAEADSARRVRSVRRSRRPVLPAVARRRFHLRTAA